MKAISSANQAWVDIKQATSQPTHPSLVSPWNPKGVIPPAGAHQYWPMGPNYKPPVGNFVNGQPVAAPIPHPLKKLDYEPSLPNEWQKGIMPGGHITNTYNGKRGNIYTNKDGTFDGSVHLDNYGYQGDAVHNGNYPSIEEAKTDLEKHMRAPRVLSQDEIEERSNMAEEGSQKISDYNKDYMARAKGQPSKLRIDHTFMDNLDHTATQAKLPKPMTLYRGINMDNPAAQKGYGNLQPGSVIKGDGTFSSASERPEVAHAFATGGGMSDNQGTILKIQAPQGFPAHKMPDFDNYDYDHPDGQHLLGLEQERLFPRGTSFNVTHSEEVENPYYNGAYNVPSHTTVHTVVPSHPSFNPGVNQTTSKVGNKMSDWTKDNKINAYKTTNLDAPFECNCGRKVATTGMARCSCGQTWNSFIIEGSDKTASKATKIVRPVDEFRDRILATRTAKKKAPGWVRLAVESAGLPSFVRSANDANGGDVAPTVFDKQADMSTMQPQAPMTGMDPSVPAANDPTNVAPVDPTANTTTPDGNMNSDRASQTSLSNNKNAAGGWPAPKTTNPAASKPAGTYKPPAQPKPAAQTTPVVTPPPTNTPNQWGPPAQAQPAGTQTIQPLIQPPVSGLPGQVPGQAIQSPGQAIVQPAAQPVPQVPTVAPAQPQRTYKMEYSEDDYKLGWALASADSPLPARKFHASFLEGYRDYYASVLADNAPGWDTVAPDFVKPEEGVNNSMSDYTDHTKGDALPDYRDEYKNKIDRDNAAGQSRSDASMTDLTGWKSSALIKELARRTEEK